MKGEDMEEAMMMISSPDNPCNVTIPQEHITTTTCPSWKLYENPFYYSHHHHHHHHHHQQQQLCQSSKHLRQVNLPLSARKIAASFWDLTFFKPVMESELDIARAQIIELKAEVEYERKARKKVESLNKRLAKELAEERRGREALERVCEELAREISMHKAEIDRMKKEVEEERKMLRMAEVLREERVQMKLAEAKILFEEKLLELEETKRAQPHTSISRIEQKNKEFKTPALSANLSGKFARLVFSEKSCDYSNIGVDSRESTRFALSEKSSSCYDNISSAVSSSMAIQRKASPEPENPHIKRGIKGFVEFPRVVRAIGSKSRHWGTKLECQKAQLRILLKQKSPIGSNSLIMS
ncbi:Branchless trichome [Theobroma cacao]|uniref:Branchless trichome n=1 Tax=Theobroma cacao TaxID=3641 RepID=A0A061G1Z6_THECC|nr:Branchless trichome [Theobroma cacao]